MTGVLTGLAPFGSAAESCWESWSRAATTAANAALSCGSDGGASEATVLRKLMVTRATAGPRTGLVDADSTTCLGLPVAAA